MDLITCRDWPLCQSELIRASIEAGPYKGLWGIHQQLPWGMRLPPRVAPYDLLKFNHVKFEGELKCPALWKPARLPPALWAGGPARVPGTWATGPWPIISERRDGLSSPSLKIPDCLPAPGKASGRGLQTRAVIQEMQGIFDYLLRIYPPKRTSGSAFLWEFKPLVYIDGGKYEIVGDKS